MAATVNERDLTMQGSPQRIVPVTAVEQIIVPGYTGIKLNSDVGYWSVGPYENNTLWQTPTSGVPTGPRETLSVVFTGMNPPPAITWQLGGYTTVYDTATSKWVITGFSELTLPQHGIILTNSADPSIKTIEAASYPYSLPYPNSTGYMGHAAVDPNLRGCVRVKVTFGGTDFVAYKNVYARGPGGRFPWG